MIRIFLVDDHPLMRKTMKQFIEAENGFQVCGEADNIDEALTAVGQLKPDVALVDISLGGNEKGIQLIQEIRANGYQVPILTISLHEEALYADKVLKAGAQGYLMKQDAPDNIVRAIKSVTGPGNEFFSVSTLSQRE